MDSKVIVTLNLNGSLSAIHNSDTNVNEQSIIESLFIKNWFRITDDLAVEETVRLLIESESGKYKYLSNKGCVSELALDLNVLLNDFGISTGQKTVRTLVFGSDQSNLLKSMLISSHYYLSVYFLDYAVFSVVKPWECVTNDTYHFVVNNKIDLEDDCAIIPGMRWMC
ncbi:19 kDa protein [Persimmon virus B]|uniref:19 kDa protein n=1 Tax=Persimmon virus B TaxID=1493829 RepID=A0A0A8JCX5_9CLOS|nr:19 kDa protein [Persimmon virus B]BAQ08213.1 19 kDa protein [Persimmon virus B]